jgi:uncharacterized membrane protein YhaH (DUF805 family)
MGFGEAVQRGIEGALRFSGRSGRHEFWWFAIFVLLSLIAATTLAAFDPRLGPPAFAGAALLLVPLTAVGVRRLHDIGWSGFGLLLALVPVVGQAMLACLLARHGEAGANRFGDDPRYGFSGSVA